jgi:adenine phosphoribosyltransferase
VGHIHFCATAWEATHPSFLSHLLPDANTQDFDTLTARRATLYLAFCSLFFFSFSSFAMSSSDPSHPSITGPTPPQPLQDDGEAVLTSLEKQTSTSSHLVPVTNTTDHGSGATGSSRRFPAPSTASTAELTSLTLKLRSSLRQFPDFPSPGILFEDIMPIFANPNLHTSLIRALELHVANSLPAGHTPDVVVGLEARGFIFGPSLALKLNAGFVPVRKKGKLPGPTVQATYQKEYGQDLFEMQKDGIKQGQKVLIVDDIIATGKL